MSLGLVVVFLVQILGFQAVLYQPLEIVTHTLAAKAKRSGMSKTIQIMSMNCQGLGDMDKCKDVFHFIRQKQNDVYFLQDTHFTINIEKYIRAMWGYECFFDSFNSQSRGVAILINSKIESKVHQIRKGNDGNKLILDITLNGKKLTLINLYGPNRDCPEFYNKVKQDIKDFENENVIIGGDFNLILDFNKDCNNYFRLNNTNAREVVLDLCAEFSLIDIWREQHMDTLQYTWKKAQPFKQSRLDFFLVSEQLATQITKSSIDMSYRSDHSAISLNIASQAFEKGRSFWKFNNSLLKDPDYIEVVKNTINTVKQQYRNQDSQIDAPNEELFSINPQLFFETLLMEIRGKTISYSTYKKRSCDKKEENLEKEINDIELNFDETKYEMLNEKKKSLQEIRQKKMEGVKVRSRARWMEDGEKPSRYFCNLENRNFISNN